MREREFNIEWSESDSEFIARCSTFPRLMAFGGTIEEAIIEGNVAFELFAASYRERGLSLPTGPLDN